MPCLIVCWQSFFNLFSLYSVAKSSSPAKIHTLYPSWCKKCTLLLKQINCPIILGWIELTRLFLFFLHIKHPFFKVLGWYIRKGHFTRMKVFCHLLHCTTPHSGYRSGTHINVQGNSFFVHGKNAAVTETGKYYDGITAFVRKKQFLRWEAIEFFLDVNFWSYCIPIIHTPAPLLLTAAKLKI